MTKIKKRKKEEKKEEKEKKPATNSGFTKWRIMW